MVNLIIGDIEIRQNDKSKVNKPLKNKKTYNINY